MQMLLSNGKRIEISQKLVEFTRIEELSYEEAADFFELCLILEKAITASLELDMSKLPKIVFEDDDPKNPDKNYKFSKDDLEHILLVIKEIKVLDE